jgi:hypothetical protein
MTSGRHDRLLGASRELKKSPSATESLDTAKVRKRTTLKHSGFETAARVAWIERVQSNRRFGFSPSATFDPSTCIRLFVASSTSGWTVVSQQRNGLNPGHSFFRVFDSERKDDCVVHGKNLISLHDLKNTIGANGRMRMFRNAPFEACFLP